MGVFLEVRRSGERSKPNGLEEGFQIGDRVATYDALYRFLESRFILVKQATYMPEVEGARGFQYTLLEETS